MSEICGQQAEVYYGHACELDYRPTLNQVSVTMIMLQRRGSIHDKPQAASIKY